MIYLILLLPFISSCQYLPDVAKDVESMETDTAIKVEVSREAINKDSNLQISVDLKNKESQDK